MKAVFDGESLQESIITRQWNTTVHILTSIPVCGINMQAA
jgi:hypothetical protein